MDKDFARWDISVWIPKDKYRGIYRVGQSKKCVCVHECVSVCVKMVLGEVFCHLQPRWYWLSTHSLWGCRLMCCCDLYTAGYHYNNTVSQNLKESLFSISGLHKNWELLFLHSTHWHIFFNKDRHCALNYAIDM